MNVLIEYVENQIWSQFFHEYGIHTLIGWGSKESTTPAISVILC